MATVQLAAGACSNPLAAPCPRFIWCRGSEAGHTVHQSAPVPLPDDTDRILFAVTDPDTGHLLYGPVLGGGDADESAGHARVLAAQLRAAADRLDALADAADHSVNSAV